MAQIAEAERRGSRVEARAVAHEGVGQRVGGLAGRCREGGGRAGLGSVRAQAVGCGAGSLQNQTL